MARIGETAFTDADGTFASSHTPTIAGTSFVTDNGQVVIQGNRTTLVGGNTDNAIVRLSDAPSGADYYVEAVLYKHSDIGQVAVGVTGRHNSSFNWTGFVYNDVDNEAQIIVVYNNGASTEEVGTSSAQTFNVTDSHTIRGVLNGNSLSLDWDGSQVVTGTSALDQTAANNAGFLIGYAAGIGAAAGIHLDSWLAENDLPSAGGSALLLQTAYYYYG